MPECARCGKESTLQCSRCKAVNYCTEECQKAHWKKTHKGQCRALEKTRKALEKSRAELVAAAMASEKPHKNKLQIVLKEERVMLGNVKLTVDEKYADTEHFYLEGVIERASQTLQDIEKIMSLHDEDLSIVQGGYGVTIAYRVLVPLNALTWLHGGNRSTQTPWFHHLEAMLKPVQPVQPVQPADDMPKIPKNPTTAKDYFIRYLPEYYEYALEEHKREELSTSDMSPEGSIISKIREARQNQLNQEKRLYNGFRYQLIQERAVAEAEQAVREKKANQAMDALLKEEDQQDPHPKGKQGKKGPKGKGGASKAPAAAPPPGIEDTGGGAAAAPRSPGSPSLGELLSAKARPATKEQVDQFNSMQAQLQKTPPRTRVERSVVAAGTMGLHTKDLAHGGALVQFEGFHLSVHPPDPNKTGSIHFRRDAGRDAPPHWLAKFVVKSDTGEQGWYFYPPVPDGKTQVTNPPIKHGEIVIGSKPAYVVGRYEADFVEYYLMHRFIELTKQMTKPKGKPVPMEKRDLKHPATFTFDLKF